MRLSRIASQLDWYIFRQLSLALIAVTLGLTALIWLVQSLRFVELVVNHGLSLWTFLKLTGLLIPSFIAVILPITTFVVVQFVYQRLVTDRELTVMRAMGLSPFALSRPVLAVVVVVIAAGYWLNLSVVPASLRAFGEFQWEIRNRLAAFLLQEGVFTNVSDDLTVYVRSRDPDGTLRGVLIDDARDKSAHATILAERGRLVEAPDGLHVLLYDGSRQEIDHQTKRLNILTFHENLVDLSQQSHAQGDRVLGMSEVSLSALFRPPNSLSEIDHGRWIAEAHKRLSTPIAALTCALIALLSILTGAFQRHASTLRPLAAVGGVVSLVALNLAFQSIGARENSLLVLLWVETLLPPVLFAALLFGPQALIWRRPLPRPA
ncbi:MAG TPA: LPS export ABC transporter permease LptF [Acetobacteraceae bacterium]|nr:LPS export ABC transporter permease LptF [Acetobacteraceae bacterium]